MTSRQHHNATRYRTRLLGSTAGVLLALLLLFRLWPAHPPAPPRVLPPGPERLITIEEIVSTTQPAAPAPPPPPDLPPVEVEEVEMEEVPLTLDVPLVTAPPRPGPPTPAPPGESATPAPPTGGVSRGLSPVRMVHPSMTDETHRRIRAEVVVEAVVDVNGRVREATVAARYLLDRKGNRLPVAALDYDLDAKALELARRWQFRPALVDGQKVEQRYPITLRWGGLSDD